MGKVQSVPPMAEVQELESEALKEIAEASSSTRLRELEMKYLGKSGLLTGLQKQIGTLPPDERRGFGQKVNESKDRVQSLLETRLESLKGNEREEQYERERIDVTMPGLPPRMGREHVLQQAANKIKSVFTGL